MSKIIRPAQYVRSMCIVEGHFQYSDETESVRFRYQEDAIPILKKARDDGKVVIEEVRHLMESVMSHLPRKTTTSNGVIDFEKTAGEILDEVEALIDEASEEIVREVKRQNASRHDVSNN
ncbi:MAG: hypothetical protein U0522_03385 [Candidatus Paceibacterota bacterium]